MDEAQRITQGIVYLFLLAVIWLPFKDDIIAFNYDNLGWFGRDYMELWYGVPLQFHLFFIFFLFLMFVLLWFIDFSEIDLKTDDDKIQPFDPVRDGCP
jgi:hypothetical protein